MKYLLPSTIADIESFFSNYPLRRYKKGQILMLPGETTNYAYLLVSGRLKLYTRSYRGDEIIVDMFKNPSFFPLSLVMNKSPTFLIHEADTDIEVRQAPIQATLDFLDTNPKLVLDLLSFLYSRFDGALQRMVHLIDSSAKVRLVHEIIDACDQIGELKPDGSYLLTISQTTLGGRIGLTRETVSREAKSLKDKKLLEITRTSMIIPDITKLKIYLDHHR
jgi:CRP/FNR family transcriptional regulator